MRNPLLTFIEQSEMSASYNRRPYAQDPLALPSIQQWLLLELQHAAAAAAIPSAADAIIVSVGTVGLSVPQLQPLLRLAIGGAVAEVRDSARR